MFSWQVLRVADGRIETVDAWDDLAAAIWEMACSSWEEPGNHWLSYIVNASGQVVATALFGPDNVLLVTICDGRQLRLPMPELYREPLPDGELATP